ncbi:MAG: hypothetical protein ACYTHM_06925, partial [Planctomycetota bacterium]
MDRKGCTRAVATALTGWLLLTSFTMGGFAEEEPLPVSQRSEIPPRGWLAWRLDGETRRLVPEAPHPTLPALLPETEPVLRRVPAWLRSDLARTLARLPFEPLRWEGDAWPSLLDL